MTIAYIGLGGNLGEPERRLRSALKSLQRIPSTKLRACSSFYRSKPLGPQDQPAYINAVAKLETSLTATVLLEHMQAIELEHGRTRGGERWGPRTLDLDLLLFGEERINQEALTVPHPGMGSRDFVLGPLVEIASEIHIPGMGLARDLLAAIDHNGGLEKIAAAEELYSE